MSTPYQNDKGQLLCDRCGRPVVGWLLKRADVCSPDRWENCIREPQAVLNGWRTRLVKEVPVRARGGRR
jgi:hypothetical protein